MRYKKENDNRYRVNFMIATEKLMDQLTVKEFISYLEENAEFEDETHEYIDGRIVTCKVYDLKEENSNLHKEFLVTEDGRVFYWRTLMDKIELVDEDKKKSERSEKAIRSRANRTEKATYRNNRNEHKFIDVVHHGDGHYYMIQYIKHELPERTVVNYMGTRCGHKQKFRIGKATLIGILEDYTKVEEV